MTGPFLLRKPPSVHPTNFEVQPVSPPELPICTSPFSESELKVVIKAAKRGGAMGLDGCYSNRVVQVIYCIVTYPQER